MSMLTDVGVMTALCRSSWLSLSFRALGTCIKTASPIQAVTIARGNPSRELAVPSLKVCLCYVSRPNRSVANIEPFVYRYVTGAFAPKCCRLCATSFVPYFKKPEAKDDPMTSMGVYAPRADNQGHSLPKIYEGLSVFLDETSADHAQHIGLHDQRNVRTKLFANNIELLPQQLWSPTKGTKASAQVSKDLFRSLQNNIANHRREAVELKLDPKQPVRIRRLTRM